MERFGQVRPGDSKMCIDADYSVFFVDFIRLMHREALKYPLGALDKEVYIGVF
jgi:hypothetical protein